MCKALRRREGTEREDDKNDEKHGKHGGNVLERLNCNLTCEYLLSDEVLYSGRNNHSRNRPNREGRRRLLRRTERWSVLSLELLFVLLSPFCVLYRRFMLLLRFYSLRLSLPFTLR